MEVEQNKIIIFQEKQIRRVWYKEEWYFSVLDVVEVLAETSNATDYFKKMRKRDEQLHAFVGTNCPQVEMMGTAGKKRKTLVANTETIFRIIQSIPSPKAEPFKQWLAKVGYERVQEIENPELAAERARQYYRDLGYDEKWVETRLQTIAIRGQLTDEWKTRGVQEGQEYAILTPEISKATFGIDSCVVPLPGNISFRLSLNLKLLESQRWIAFKPLLKTAPPYALALALSTVAKQALIKATACGP